MRRCLLSVSAALCLCSMAFGQLDDILKKADAALEHPDTSGLSDDKIIAGLKQALQVSTTKAVAITGKPDGFLKNEAIKIVLPPRLETIGRGLRMVGMGNKIDELEVGMNRAAEQATPQAKQIFLAALKKMSFDDARHNPRRSFSDAGRSSGRKLRRWRVRLGINTLSVSLTGNDTAATEYFKRTSSGDLAIAFSPIVHQSMEKVGVVQQYDRVIKEDKRRKFAKILLPRLQRC